MHSRRVAIHELSRPVRFAALLMILAATRPALSGDAADVLPRAKPSDLKLNDAKLAEIQGRMQHYVDQKQLAGAVTLVAYQGKIVHLEATGHADIAAKRAMTADTMFSIASMTKPITGAAVMILVDEGKLSLDDPVAKYIPQFKHAKLASGAALKRDVTIRDVVTHTSGVIGDQQNMGSLKATAEKLAERPLGFQPGAKWQYGPGLSVAGAVVEAAAQQPFQEFLKARIFQPLGMNDTTFNPSAEQQARLAQLYQQNKDKTELEPTGHWINEVSPNRPPNPSGGLFSTASDIARFYQMLLNSGELGGKRVLSVKAAAEFSKVQSAEEHVTGFTPGNGWGVGCCVVRQPQGITAMLSPGSFGHGGAFGTQSWADPVKKMTFILMIQRVGLPNADGSDMRRDLQTLAVEALR